MTAVNVTELSEHLPAYLEQVQKGEEILITLNGKTIARLVPEHAHGEREAALRRLGALRGKMIVGDILTPIEAEWSGDAGHL